MREVRKGLMAGRLTREFGWRRFNKGIQYKSDTTLPDCVIQAGKLNKDVLPVT